MKRSLFCLLVLVSVSPLFAGVVTYRPEVEKLQATLERAVQEKLNLIGTRENPILATLTLSERKSANPNEPSTLLDFPYGPMNPDATEAALFGDPIDVEKVQVVLFAPRETPKSLIQAATEITESTLKRFRPVVTINYWDRNDSNEAPAPVLSHGGGGAGKVHWTAQLSRLALWAVPIAHFLLLGLVLFVVLRRRQLPLVKNSARKTVLAAAAPPTRHEADDSRRQIQQLTGFLREHPLLFLNTLEDEDRDFRGFAGLLPHLSPEDHSQLGQLLGKPQLEKLAVAMATPEPSLEFHARWRAKLLGQLILRKLSGRSLVMDVLSADSELQRTFRQAPADALLSAARASKSRGAWRLAAELVSRPALTEAIAEDSKLWPIVFASAEATADEVRAAAREMSGFLRKKDSKTNAGTNAYASTKLLELTASVLAGRGHAEQQQILETLRTTAPQLAELVTMRIWTPDVLRRLPTEWLRDRLRALSEVQLAQLLVSLPDTAAQALRTALSNDKRLAVAENLRRKQPQASAETLAFTESFLATLRASWTSSRLRTPPGEEKKPAVRLAA